jgi:hypothetical protein
MGENEGFEEEEGTAARALSAEQMEAKRVASGFDNGDDGEFAGADEGEGGGVWDND